MKEHPDYPGYFITESGEVYSNRRGALKKIGGGVSNLGYHQVMLCHNKVRRCRKVHRLVAELYIPNPDNLPDINHKDRNKLNNSVDNLEWVNHQQNMEHACAKVWQLRNRNTGETIEVYNLRKWCRENNRLPASLRDGYDKLWEVITSGSQS